MDRYSKPFNRYSNNLLAVVQMAEDLSKQYNTPYIGTEHIMFALIKSRNTTAGKILAECGANEERYAQVFERNLDMDYSSQGYTPKTRSMLYNAVEVAEENGGPETLAGTEHMLYTIFHSPSCLGTRYLGICGVNVTLLAARLEEAVKGDGRQGGQAPQREKPDDESDIFIIVREQQMRDRERRLREIRERSMRENGEDRSSEQPDTPPEDGPMSGPGRYSERYGDRARRPRSEEIPYCEDLTKKARDGKIDPVIGRKAEIDRIMQVLSRKTKNNPILIGEAGVGKTAVVEGLAQAIANNEVPDSLKGKKLLSLDLSGMVAGTRYRGDFEERMKNVMDRVTKDGNVILFIDEIHQIVGAGETSEGSMDAGNMMKPLLARGEMQTIGATTINEYRKYFEKDEALARRFNPIQIDEPSCSDTVEILKGIRDSFERYHNLVITDEAIEAAVKLTDRYVTERHLPDKAIDVMDEAASKVKMAALRSPKEIQDTEERLKRLSMELDKALADKDFKECSRIQAEIDETQQKAEELKSGWENQKTTTNLKIGVDDIVEIVSEMSGIPVSKMTEEESERLLKLEERLHERIVGQDEAVTAVAKAIRRSKSGLGNPERPIGSFIFVGPTGVGKTDLAKALAETMFGDEKFMIRLDMSEYMEKADVSKLIGAAPGYVGYDDNNGGTLAEKVRTKPYSVVLFDEIEKAHPDVFNMLLQILDDGRLTDNRGRLVNFKNTIIIMTSNVGADEINKMSSFGFAAEDKKEENDYEKMKDVINSSLRSKFKPEFLNRVDDIIVFRKLSKREIRHIAEKEIVGVERRLADRDISLEVTDAALDRLTEEGYDDEYGARPLKRAIQRRIEDRLADEILAGRILSGETVRADYSGEDFVFSSEKK